MQFQILTTLMTPYQATDVTFVSTGTLATRRVALELTVSAENANAMAMWIGMQLVTVTPPRVLVSNVFSTPMAQSVSLVCPAFMETPWHCPKVTAALVAAIIMALEQA